MSSPDRKAAVQGGFADEGQLTGALLTDTANRSNDRKGRPAAYQVRTPADRRPKLPFLGGGSVAAFALEAAR